MNAYFEVCLKPNSKMRSVDNRDEEGVNDLHRVRLASCVAIGICKNDAVQTNGNIQIYNIYLYLYIYI